ncbi:snapalysin [Streptomyces sp. UNOB3_S3]|uniref:snapalysin n=1 Tax=Streptomyces sp. UNOB3_S3 TaxID=2871682 RepID=UPI001E405160|nr:snapalysin [Streptomyces sp. UNOB3_S3]MCC3777298.1 snapalysin [Streptomyces sp. UNOB3_S3]
MNRSTMVLSAALGLGLAATMTAGPAVAADHSSSQASTVASRSAYIGSAAEESNNKAFFDAVMKSAQAKRAANPQLQVVTVTYDPSSAPSFAQEIANSAQIWNSSVRNVQLRAGSNADFRYYEGNDSRGSYASTDGHGRGYIFLDYQQNEQYDSTRVTAHETGHVLGLPDHYSGPCSELMSGGGPGPSCTNPYPNTAERGRVNQLWANGLKAGAIDKGLTKIVR